MTAIRIAELEATNARLVSANLAVQKKLDDVTERLEVLLHRVEHLLARRGAGCTAIPPSVI